MRLVFKYEQDSVEVYEVEDNYDNALAHVRIYRDYKMFALLYLDFSEEIKEKIFSLLRMFKDDLNINGYKLDSDYYSYDDYMTLYNTDIIE